MQIATLSGPIQNLGDPATGAAVAAQVLQNPQVQSFLKRRARSAGRRVSKRIQTAKPRTRTGRVLQRAARRVTPAARKTGAVVQQNFPNIFQPDTAPAKKDFPLVPVALVGGALIALYAMSK